MQRARRSTLSLLFLGFALLGIVGMSPFSVQGLGPAAAVGWPASAGVVVAEVVTGAASASDEFVELANAGPATVDLLNLELVYVSAAGTSATRKVAWLVSRPVAPGQHLLVANAAGVFATTADATYSSGIAATGGAVALRVIGGSVVDAVGWGDATNAFVEGAAASAPAAGASIERKPGGAGGNRTDTNDNAADFAVQAHPIPQNLAAAPTPSSSVTPTATGTPTSSAGATATLTAEPSATPDPSASTSAGPSSTAGPTDTPALTDSPAPSVDPSPTEPPVSASTEPVVTDPPTPSPTDSPTPSPTDSTSPTDPPTATETPQATPVPTDVPDVTPDPDPTDPPSTPTATPQPSASVEPVAVAIADARAAADGTRLTIEGVLTAALGAFDGGRGAFVQDDSAGIALYLDGVPSQTLPAGTRVRITGVLDQRYSQRVLRPAVADVVDLGGGSLPSALEVPTRDATETNEGRRVTVEGTMSGSASDVADGVSFTIDDGSGPVRVIVAAAPAGLSSGVLVRATGPLGQRDSSGTGTAGYRVYALDPVDVQVLVPSATPIPSVTPTRSVAVTPTPAPNATPPRSPSPSPTQSPTPSASPSPSPSALPVTTIAAARTAAIGTRVRLRGTVTGESGRVGTSLVSIQDDSGGIAVHLPAGVDPPSRGAVLDVVGDLAAPYGQLEIRPTEGSYRVDGSADAPASVALASTLDESLEGLLVTLQGLAVTSVATGSSGDLTFDVDLAGGARIRVQADAASGVAGGSIHRGSHYRLTGVVGQHASAAGRLDGYRVWLRGPDDVEALADPSPSPSPSATPKPTSTPKPTATPKPAATPKPSPTQPSEVTIAAAIVGGGNVVVEGVITAGSGLLDAAGRTAVIQDASAAVQVRLPAGTKMRAGRRVRVAGESGRSYGAPRILAATAKDTGAGTLPAPSVLRAQPTAAVEWRLVRVSGVVKWLRRDGQSWKAEIAAGATVFLVEALSGAGIPSDRLRVGGSATITGIVRRPYPTAVDRRFTILPRSSADVTASRGAAIAADTSGPASPKPTRAATGGGTAPNPATARRATASSQPTGAGQPAGDAAAPIDVDLVDLPAAAGRLVRVGGLVVSLDASSVVIDDGTAQARATLQGDATTMLGQVRAGSALNLIGTAVEGTPLRLTVEHASDVLPIADITATATDDASAAPSISAAASSGASDPLDAFGLSGDEVTDGTDDAPAPVSNVPLVVALLGGMTVLGAFALRLRRRPHMVRMAHPRPPARP